MVYYRNTQIHRMRIRAGDNEKQIPQDPSQCIRPDCSIGMPSAKILQLFYFRITRLNDAAGQENPEEQIIVN